MEKKPKKMRKQDWSIDEWLEASAKKQKKQKAKRGQSRKWDRKLGASIEIIMSSPDICIGEEKDKEEVRGCELLQVRGGELLHVMGSPPEERSRIPEHAADDGDSSQETLILGSRGVSRSQG